LYCTYTRKYSRNAENAAKMHSSRGILIRNFRVEPSKICCEISGLCKILTLERQVERERESERERGRDVERG
jgi:hypothetical protein